MSAGGPALGCSWGHHLQQAVCLSACIALVWTSLQASVAAATPDPGTCSSCKQTVHPPCRSENTVCVLQAWTWLTACSLCWLAGPSAVVHLAGHLATMQAVQSPAPQSVVAPGQSLAAFTQMAAAGQEGSRDLLLPATWPKPPAPLKELQASLSQEASVSCLCWCATSASHCSFALS